MAPRRDAQTEANNDDDNTKASSNTQASTSNRADSSGGDRKRRRSCDNETPQAACDACRSRKVKCDRQQPVCSNCRKAGVFCDSSNTFRRVNHAKQLRDEFSSVLERLNDVDQTLSTLTQLTQQIAACRPCAHGSHNQSPVRGFDTIPPSLFEEQLSIEKQEHPDSLAVGEMGLGLEDFTETVELEHGGRLIYGYPAPQSLIKSLSRQLARVLNHTNDSSTDDSAGSVISQAGAVQDPSVRVALRRQLDDFPFNKPCPEPIIKSDQKPITIPPRLLVGMFVDSFLVNINSSIPIFEKAALHQAIEAHYSSSPQSQNSPWALTMTSIVVLGLALETQSARALQSHSRSMNDDLIPSLLRNCDRALANLSTFMRPCLANVQALATLALVAREFYGNITFESVCQAACQLGRMLGLHRSQTGSESSMERENLYRALYAMDKQRVFMTGRPCELYSFDADPDTGRATRQDYPQLNEAFDQLMRIWEEMYLTLFSPKAAGASPANRSHQVSLIEKSTQRWEQQYHKLLDIGQLAGDGSTKDKGNSQVLASPPSSSSSSSSSSSVPPPGTGHLAPMQLELKYCYHVTLVLALGCNRRDARSQQQLRTSARTCLKIIAELGAAPLTTARLASLARILGNYPMVAFIHLFHFHISAIAFLDRAPDAETESDAELLQAVRHHLQALHHSDYPNVYFGRLQKGLTWALGILDIVKGARYGPVSTDMTTLEPLANLDSLPSGRIEKDPIEARADLTSFGFYTPLSAGCHALDLPPDSAVSGMDMSIDIDLFQGMFTTDEWHVR